jgi:bifunctional DNase/RNase
VPDIADLASVVLRRCYERVETGEATVTIRDAVAILRLPNEIEHDDALAERDAARRQMEEWRRESAESPRPFTPKLAVSLVEAAGSGIEEVRIARLLEGVFYATVIVRSPAQEDRTGRCTS